jgi:hypothetical protein
VEGLSGGTEWRGRVEGQSGGADWHLREEVELENRMGCLQVPVGRIRRVNVLKEHRLTAEQCVCLGIVLPHPLGGMLPVGEKRSPSLTVLRDAMEQLQRRR